MPLGETPEEINTKNSKIALTVHKILAESTQISSGRDILSCCRNAIRE